MPPPGMSGWGANRVHSTTPSGDGSPDATPSENGFSEKGGAANARDPSAPMMVTDAAYDPPVFSSVRRVILWSQSPVMPITPLLLDRCRAPRSSIARDGWVITPGGEAPPPPGRRVRAMTTREVTAGDGRTLRYVEAGDPGGPLLIGQHGTPGSGRLFRAEVEGAERLGARLVAYSRPGYGGSTPQPERSVADAAADVAALLDALGAERFATYGWSGGGPHALACAALLPERCAAAATIAGAAPSDQPDLDFVTGMGDGNVEELDRKSTRLNSSHGYISYAVFCLKKK